MQAAPSDSSSPAGTSRGPDDRESNRVPLERQVALRFEDFEGFITECSMNISATGMFIRCSDPQPAGSVLDFEFSMVDGEKLVRGYGEVMWARRQDSGPDHPAGMGIRFLHLDAESRELIRWTVTRRYITGAGPCDLDEIRTAMRRAAEEESADSEQRPAAGMAGAAFGIAVPPEPGEALPRYREAGFGAAAVGRSPRRPLRLVLPLAVLALGGLFWLRAPSRVDAAAHQGADQIATVEPVATPEAPVVPAARPAVVPAAEPATEPAVNNPPEPAFSKGAIEQTPADLATAWASAWSEQRATDYLAHYAAGFRPPRGLTRHAWEKQRQVRILRPRSIAVVLSGVTAEELGPDRARVRFQQTYQSDTYRDVVNKTLELVREAGDWRILEERVDG